MRAAGRSKARDIADLVATGLNYCPLGPLILAAAGKPPNFSQRRTIDEIRRHTLSIPAEDLGSIKGLPADWTAAFVRDEALRLTDLADQYVMSASPDLLGILSVDKNGTPIAIVDRKTGDAVLRKATDEPEVMPAPLNSTR